MCMHGYEKSGLHAGLAWSHGTTACHALLDNTETLVGKNTVQALVDAVMLTFASTAIVCCWIMTASHWHES